MTAWAYRTMPPEHAIVEMEADPKQRQFWEAWAAVGDAKLDESSASRDVVEAEQAWHECCIKHQVNLPNCGCGEHPRKYLAARNRRDAARRGVAKAQTKFKRGR